ncbi:hypothetical protein Lal_00018736 [Lupinus albus]|nr:hypothetical protein Lal_00018736 [Lupinus albus]
MSDAAFARSTHQIVLPDNEYKEYLQFKVTQQTSSPTSTMTYTVCPPCIGEVQLAQVSVYKSAIRSVNPASLTF